MPAEPFYPFVEPDGADKDDVPKPTSPARIAVYDDMSIAPRVVTIEATDIRTYLEQITATVYELASQQGADWPFTLIRELVENYIHAFFEEPTVSILDKGLTLTFSDQGPGIPDKQAALKPSFSSATKAMKRYIRGVGSGLPVVEEQIKLKHGTIKIEDNIGRGTIVTVSLKHDGADAGQRQGAPAVPAGTAPQGQSPYPTYPQQTPAAPAAYPYAAPVQQYATAGYYADPYRTPPQQQLPAGYPQYAAQAVPGAPAYPYQQPVQYAPMGTQQPAMPAGYAPVPPFGGAYPGQPPYTTAAPQQQQAPATFGAAPFDPNQTTHMSEQHARLTEEQSRILLLFASMSTVGPSELAARGIVSSVSTATRRLKDLAQMGMVVKTGQKYELTSEGRFRLDALVRKEGGDR